MARTYDPYASNDQLVDWSDQDIRSNWNDQGTIENMIRLRNLSRQRMTGSEGGGDAEFSKWKDREAAAKQSAATAEAQRIADLKSQGLNPDGSPMKQQYQSQIDPATGLLKKEYLLNAPNIDTDKLEGYQAYKNEALRKGPSAWLNMALENQKTEQSQGNDDAMAAAQQSRANTISGLAMRGGASSGARERALRNADTDAMYGRQKVGAQGAITRSALGMKDEENRLGMLGNFSKGEADIARFNTEMGGKSSEFNIVNALRDREGKNAFDLETYKEQMQKWAAEKQAQATASSGGGGK